MSDHKQTTRAVAVPHPDTAKAEAERHEQLCEHFRQRGEEIAKLKSDRVIAILEGK